jgi:hypothetical protein
MDAPAVHEGELLRAFLLPEARDRFLALLETSKGRAKLRGSLAHLQKLDRRFCTPIPAESQDAYRIAELLRTRGAPRSCWVIAEDTALDGCEMLLEEALTAVLGRGMGALLSCIPGRLGYYEGEGPSERWILERGAD